MSTIGNLPPLYDANFKTAVQQAELRKTQADARYEKKVREACQGFEKMFLQMMYRQMRATVPDNTLFGNSHSLKLWQSMLDDQMMEEVAKGGGLGLADMIYDQLSTRNLIKKPSSVSENPVLQ